MRSFNFCNNCGKSGHLYQSCKEAIMSIGIIAFRKIDNKIEYLMICRKNTLGFVDFIRGRYNLSNIEYISNLISIMTMEEKNLIVNKSFDELWKYLWGSNIAIQYRGEESYAREKFDTIQKGYNNNSEFVNIKKLVNNNISKWIEPEWGFPKGRRNYQERDIYCAIREFSEETGYDEDNINIINNIIPYEEIFLGSNYKSYKHKYYLGEINNDAVKSKSHQETEVSKVEWKSYEDSLLCIRDYNLEKKEILKKVHTVLSENNLCI